MMNFRLGKESIVNILSTAAGGRFQTIGAQKQVKGAKDFEGAKRYVQVYYSSGNFEKGVGRQNGPTQHNVTYKIEMSVAAAAKVDLSTLVDPQSTPAQKATALAAMTEASDVADELLDELFEIVYQIIMDGRNLDLGLPVGTFSQRWIDQIQKDDPVPHGELLVLTGTALLQAKTAEQVPGDIGSTGTTNDTTIQLEGDDAKLGVTEVN